MRFLSGLGVAALALILGGTAKPAAAQWGQQVPPGSYQQTCRNVGVRGDTLYADCQDANRNWQRTQLNDYNRCPGEIQNLNGSLQCTGNNGYPQGTYNGPNNGPYNNGPYNDGNGGYYGRDRHRDHDRDGDDDDDRRVNDGYGNGGYGYPNGGYYGNGIPYGSYSQTCQNVQIAGNQLRASCQKRNGHWHNTSLSNFQQCRDIENDNGKLKCR